MYLPRHKLSHPDGENYQMKCSTGVMIWKSTISGRKAAVPGIADMLGTL
jgi:hypothetical protein